MTWHRVTMDSAQIASMEQIRLQHEFAALLLATAAAHGGDPKKDMVAFSSWRPESVEDTWLYHHYFSPGCLPEAAQLLRRYNAVECEAPPNDQVAFFGGLHYGDPWDLIGGRPDTPPWSR